MISYVKIYGPPVFEALRALEGIAVGMPEVCIMSTTYVASDPSLSADAERMYNYLTDIGFAEVTRERCSTIVSRSGERLGEYDFFFEWFKDPSMEELGDLIKRVDAALSPLGARYTITTR